MARSDEIDELVSSVRNLVAHKQTGALRKMPPPDRLILTDALRIDVPAAAPDWPKITENTAFTAQTDLLVLENAITPDQVSLEATIVELEAAVTARAEDWEPDEGETFDQAAWAVSAFQLPQDDSLIASTPDPVVENDTAAPPVSETADIRIDLPDQPLPEADDAPAEDDPSDLEAQIASDLVMQHFGAQIDEAALRDAVLRILREELSGDMGERITRNVRKLVRREINRVLVSRDLD